MKIFLKNLFLLSAPALVNIAFLSNSFAISNSLLISCPDSLVESSIKVCTVYGTSSGEITEISATLSLENLNYQNFTLSSSWSGSVTNSSISIKSDSKVSGNFTVGTLSIKGSEAGKPGTISIDNIFFSNVPYTEASVSGTSATILVTEPEPSTSESEDSEPPSDKNPSTPTIDPGSENENLPTTTPTAPSTPAAPTKQTTNLPLTTIIIVVVFALLLILLVIVLILRKKKTTNANQPTSIVEQNYQPIQASPLNQPKPQQPTATQTQSSPISTQTRQNPFITPQNSQSESIESMLSFTPQQPANPFLTQPQPQSSVPVQTITQTPEAPMPLAQQPIQQSPISQMPPQSNQPISLEDIPFKQPSIQPPEIPQATPPVPPAVF